MSTKRLLCLSNGHGEDLIATRIAEALLAYDVEILALPVVGEGEAYRQLGLKIVVPTRTMPSGGFIYMDVREFWKDVRGGLGRLTFEQWRTLRRLAPACDLVLAVGDIVVLALAYLSKAPYAFVGTAKSDYYQGGRPTDYTSLERWLLNRPACRAAFPRDRLTTDNLRRWVPQAVYLGNPMMDKLEAGPDLATAPPAGAVVALLLPGSRAPEACRNLALMLQAVEPLAATFPQPLHLLCARAGSLSDEGIRAYLPVGWQLEGPLLRRDKLTVHLEQGRFAECLQRSHLVIAMAGTATEQAVGLGRPVFTLAGEGPQFTPRFAEAQTRLLGESVQLVEGGPAELASRVRVVMADAPLRERIRLNGTARMGTPGAARRIAQHVIKLIT
ncbi:lipid-A-disaccharide synthase-related protein [Gloeobacter kilaueensis]|uniref:Lipid-A-disaccharide synthase n=1 Tax=Gloeobacter kilaueensis (strain ATCC BAA-2537 / CCAP 1431/1 / ULC 316 / JS1) TaxID=1183438 RepID=U5QMN1_GLOK1|nr:lipid-A-disaccharide synthase-related protein [Gloeobacter kilaueensis]AGY60262.1 lipid-A-disaccharide synthase [Gloeobacter kilaueensis JS1]